MTIKELETKIKREIIETEGAKTSQSVAACGNPGRRNWDGQGRAMEEGEISKEEEKEADEVRGFVHGSADRAVSASSSAMVECWGLPGLQTSHYIQSSLLNTRH